MKRASTILRLADMVQAIQRMREVMIGVSVEAFEEDW